MSICPHCLAEFSPSRADQVYCCAKCRQAHYHATKGDGALRGAITAVRRLTRGQVSVTVRFQSESADYALRLELSKVVEVIPTFRPRLPASAAPPPPDPPPNRSVTGTP